MKTPDIKRIAKEFANSSRGDIWPFVGSMIRMALLDAEIMDQVRAAYSSDADKAITPEQLCTWRRELEETLEKGINRRNAPPLRLEVYR